MFPPAFPSAGIAVRSVEQRSSGVCSQAVVDHIKEEVRRLNAAEEHILSTTGPEDERLELIYERLEALDPNQFEAEASKLLHGLGFGPKMMAKATKDMSGGWRMRVALARALFAAPTLLVSCAAASAVASTGTCVEL